MARALGAQVSSSLNVDLVWDLTTKQLRTTLALAQVRTTDVLQRAQVAQAVIVPKMMYVGRHAWPSASRIRALQTLVNNYVWHGWFDEACSGRAWMSHDSATLARRDGGIALPDLASEFLQLSANTVRRWSERATGLRGEIGELLGGVHRTRAAQQRPQRGQAGAPRLRPTLALTGAAILAGLTAQPRADDERALSTDLLKRVGRGTLSTRWWGEDWFYADYQDQRSRLHALRAVQEAAHGEFNFHGLLGARICGDSVFLDASGREVRASDFGGVVRPTDRVGDVLEMHWVAAGRVRFRCRTVPFPLPPKEARAFRRLCDTLVYNYPALLAPHDPDDVVRVQPATIDSWRLSDRDGSGFDLIWEPSAGLHINLGVVRTTSDVTARVRAALDESQARALDHKWLGPVRTIWHAPRPVITQATARQFIRAVKTQRGKRDNAARGRRLTERDVLIGTAQERRSWKDIDRLAATTSRQRLQLRRIKGNRIQGWDRLHSQHGCPHCPEARDGGQIPHIFWACPEAQRLWTVLRSAWQGLDVWKAGPAGDALFQQAVFDLRLPRFPGRLWNLPDLAAIPARNVDDIEQMHATALVAWQQQVLSTKMTIWRWRHNIEDGEQQWTAATAETYLTSVLRATTRSLLDRLPRARRLRDPRRQLLRALAGCFEDCTGDRSAPDRPAEERRSVLFFDGGSRGNPGPGGAGAVLVTMAADATAPRVEWSACMSYQQSTMTNNQAEYLGAIAGLREAEARGLRPEVVGDSALILRQLRQYRPPRNARLRPLYSEARRLADVVQVEVWQHHPRAYNKMADAAANVAMDTRTSSQVSHPSARPHTEAIDALLASDFTEWLTRHLLRNARD